MKNITAASIDNYKNPFLSLPDEMKMYILSFLTGPDWIILGKTCKELHRLTNDESLWQREVERTFHNISQRKREKTWKYTYLSLVKKVSQRVLEWGSERRGPSPSLPLALKYNKTFILHFVQEYGDVEILKLASDKLRNDKEVVLAAVQQNSEALQNASKELRNNKEVVLAAVKQNSWALQDASDELRNNKEVVLAAVQPNGLALKYASAELRNDKEVALTAVRQSSWALEDASDALRNDKEVVLAAVRQNGWVLQNASDALRNDKEVVLAAVQQESRALKYASDELRNDRDVVLAARQS